jgi:hypothetical protein
MINDLYKGKLGLPRTFWIFGVAIWLFISLIFSACLKLIPSFHNINPIIVLAGIMAVYLIYTGLIPIAIWRSTKPYNGKQIWKVLAKLYAVLMYGVFLLPALSHVIPLSLNPKTAVVIDNLHPTVQMPFIGFWKVNKHQQFGVAIADAGKGMYSISFCGPGGCFEPGEWTPNTTIVNDSHYRIIDENTIEFVETNRSTIYRRFTKGLPNKSVHTDAE